MASWTEIERVRKSAGTFKPLATHLLNLPDGNWWEGAERFLRDISVFKYSEISTRQSEYLLKLRDDKLRHFEVAGRLSVFILIRKCYEARFDLDDDDDLAFVEGLYSSGRDYVTGRQLGWFIRICKQLNEIEQYV